MKSHRCNLLVEEGSYEPAVLWLSGKGPHQQLSLSSLTPLQNILKWC